jgi:pilus assembly protein CpaE
MSEAVRLMLIDPTSGSSNSLKQQIETLDELELVEVGQSYPTALHRIVSVGPELVIVVIDDDLDEATSLIARITEERPGIGVLPAGSEGDAGAILQVIRAGAREFLPLPATSIEIVDAVLKLVPRRSTGSAGPRGPHVIAVTGAAGGVGCTTLAVNLATTLAKLSRRDTVLADFDLLLGSLEECLGVIPDNSLEIVVRNLDEMDSSLLKRCLPRHSTGLYMLPHPVAMEESARLEPDSLRRVLTLLKDSFDSVVIDLSKGLQFSDFLSFELADVILVVLQLNLNCTRNTVRLIQYLRSFEGYGEKIRLVVNRVNSPLSEISVKKAEELLKSTLKWQVSNATKLFRPARTLGVPIDEVDGGTGSKPHQEFLAMAQELQPFPPEPAKPKKRIFSAFR